eukprot:6470209-Amphidinium_carterae.2
MIPSLTVRVAVLALAFAEAGQARILVRGRAKGCVRVPVQPTGWVLPLWLEDALMHIVLAR